MNLRQLARGQDCMIRLPNVCNRDPETTVLAHFRMIGLSGMGHKPRQNDIWGAWACSACHAYVDTHKDDATVVDFLKGVIRTQAAVIELRGPAGLTHSGGNRCA
jgi:hypothetical protein